MQFTLATVVAALPFLALAVPAPQGVTTKIALNKRSSLTHADGSVNSAKLQAHLAASTAKIQRGFAVCHQISMILCSV